MFQTEEEAYAAYKSRKVKLDAMSDDDVSLAANGALMANDTAAQKILDKETDRRHNSKKHGTSNTRRYKFQSPREAFEATSNLDRIIGRARPGDYALYDVHSYRDKSDPTVVIAQSTAEPGHTWFNHRWEMIDSVMTRNGGTRIDEARGNRLSEAPQDTRYMSQADAEDLIASADPDAVSKQDIVDEDDQWVYLEAGESFGEARLKPEPQQEFDCDYCKDTGKDEAGGPCDVCGDWDEIVSTRREKAESELRAAIEEYAKNYSNWAGETGWSGDMDAVGDEEMYAPDRVASDAASGFFAEHPNWREWTKVLEIPRTELQSWVADEVYEAMVNSAKGAAF